MNPSPNFLDKADTLQNDSRFFKFVQLALSWS